MRERQNEQAAHLMENEESYWSAAGVVDFTKSKTRLKKKAIPKLGLPMPPLSEEILEGFPLKMARTAKVQLWSCPVWNIYMHSLLQVVRSVKLTIQQEHCDKQHNCIEFGLVCRLDKYFGNQGHIVQRLAGPKDAWRRKVLTVRDFWALSKPNGHINYQSLHTSVVRAITSQTIVEMINPIDKSNRSQCISGEGRENFNLYMGHSCAGIHAHRRSHLRPITLQPTKHLIQWHPPQQRAHLSTAPPTKQ
ncbi:hypothetical protein MSG28_011757 [Choristoneura fumiferana]|uniref:Uncharacterized protein n=1 Tax=Choristoneura fumiferana TaxID=7141 RepID=A0ACC0KLN7_CHOFU|nr:hypothetical protein MSG28_011757 [Choristoneura fumiferana]